MREDDSSAGWLKQRCGCCTQWPCCAGGQDGMGRDRTGWDGMGGQAPPAEPGTGGQQGLGLTHVSLYQYSWPDVSGMQSFTSLRGCHSPFHPSLKQSWNFLAKLPRAVSWSRSAGTILRDACGQASHPNSARFCQPEQGPWWICAHEGRCGGLVFWPPGLSLTLIQLTSPEVPRS